MGGELKTIEQWLSVHLRDGVLTLGSVKNSPRGQGAMVPLIEIEKICQNFCKQRLQDVRKKIICFQEMLENDIRL